MSDKVQEARNAAEKYLLTSDYMGKEYKRTVLDAYRDALLDEVERRVQNLIALGYDECSGKFALEGAVITIGLMREEE